MNLPRLSITLVSLAVFAACNGKALDVGTADRDLAGTSANANPDEASADGGTCSGQTIYGDVPPPPAESAPPPSLVGTWVISSTDLTGDSPWHESFDPTRPPMTITFASDGTFRAAACEAPSDADVCEIIVPPLPASAPCPEGAACGIATPVKDPTSCTAVCIDGKYTYQNGHLTAEGLGTAAGVDIFTIPGGVVAKGGFAFDYIQENENYVSVTTPTNCP